ncbi:hypothetical protein Asppvi_011108 [Aspergillus pseudoviridinutans]|uniref:Hemerythrin-like domain-containing protein n=1 Tax=Aspergillus pseudoviridinutans TaxID=1517512 RepID=A0A9P3BIX6_9EURO|nr:uncharacterized protein Asppvi_011108 [Aspergillus pseudoviridinutans]GIJ92132.1 hypothetical protein Asppvi_011108 [Aspergillus pseudoviridinutans]
MATFYDFDPQKPFREQLEEETGPVVLTNTFTIPEGRMDEAIETWRKTAEILRFCPGYISTQLHRGVSSHILINVAVWDSAHHLRDGLNREDFKAVLASFPPGTECRAHLFRRQAVEGLNFCSQLAAHHLIEEQYLFPFLAEKMPEFRRGVELLHQHEQIHAGMNQLQEYLNQCVSGTTEMRMDKMKQLMDTFGPVLWTHLDDEVRALGAETMRRYWTQEEMKNFPF